MSGKLVPFDFEKKDVLMKSMIIQTVEGKDAIKYKVEKAMRTDKKRAKIYKNCEYGIDKDSIIGKEFYSHQIEIDDLKNDIEKTIISIDGVVEVNKIVASIEEDRLTVSYEINTIYGELGGTIE